MKVQTKPAVALVCLAVAIVGACTPTSSTNQSVTIDEQVSGLWFYTRLATADGVELPLTGVFLLKDGTFLQQAVFEQEPFEQAGSMAHAGPYKAEPATDSVHLVAEQTISVAPHESPALSFRRSTDHDVTVDRDGNALTLTFGMGTGTVQEFSYAGPGNGEIYSLANGAFALIDGHFVLVSGDETGVTTGYGTFDRTGEQLTLNVIRWAESDGETASNLKDTQIKATFDGKTLTLDDGNRFSATVTHPESRGVRK